MAAVHIRSELAYTKSFRNRSLSPTSSQTKNRHHPLTLFRAKFPSSPPPSH
ncbi:hypothetical protein PAMP_022139 [Pampus punctatissimus]